MICPWMYISGVVAVKVTENTTDPKAWAFVPLLTREFASEVNVSLGPVIKVK